MQTLQAVIVGAVQGFSEFLPVSSSAHIVFASALYKIFTGAAFMGETSQQEIFFDIMVHLGTLIAVLVYFYKDILNLIKGFTKGLMKKNYANPDFKICVYIIVATFITGIIAFALKDITHNLVENPFLICGFLIVTGFILFFCEKFYKGDKNISFKSALLIGLAQGLAIFPGLSRSGLTIATGIFKGLSRVQAARFSFLLSIPIILLASMAYPMLEIDFNDFATYNFKAITAGFFVSFVTGYICIKYFMKLLAKSTLKSFAYYCWTAGVVMFVVFAVCYHL